MVQFLLDNIFSTIIGLIVTGIIGLIPLVTASNRKYFRLLEEFRKKLPPKSKKSIAGFNPRLGATLVRLDSLKTNISEAEFDALLKELEDFKYNKILFRRERIIKHSRNIQRILNTTPSLKFRVSIVQDLLEKETFTDHWPYLINKRLYSVLKC